MTDFTSEDLRALEDIQALQAAMERLTQVGENPLILRRLNRLYVNLLTASKDVVNRYNEAQKVPDGSGT